VGGTRRWSGLLIKDKLKIVLGQKTRRAHAGKYTRLKSRKRGEPKKAKNVEGGGGGVGGGFGGGWGVEHRRQDARRSDHNRWLSKKGNWHYLGWEGLTPKFEVALSTKGRKGWLNLSNCSDGTIETNTEYNTPKECGFTPYNCRGRGWSGCTSSPASKREEAKAKGAWRYRTDQLGTPS